MPAVWHTAVLVVAAASALVSAGAALMETDLKRIIAYCTVSQIAFIFLGFGRRCGNRRSAWRAALLYILMHGLAKGGLFLCAGIVEQNTHTKDIRKLGGLIKDDAGHGGRVPALRVFGDGHPAVRRVLQQIHGDRRRGRERAALDRRWCSWPARS